MENHHVFYGKTHYEWQFSIPEGIFGFRISLKFGYLQSVSGYVPVPNKDLGVPQFQAHPNIILLAGW
jgi:hypothetical protein